ncbi:hypothetical protein [Microbulbifer hydrolyticus]|uniref:Tetratricopeptide (TPR) repeat protein n=1 Tax=Microbulbifer hydrolyticus TaxID=48074 RepID=A0A6P1TC33_9GAMM|nr:hypothetical protein [Microbulbifer hydrolyticus]MBB5209904.1 tetratricopeptide (TPR) repeat protein [Microbulbifer hydrolyticus]QHQ39557.1 hypothetical protein GTQ55_11570 [Microbulbifer hydrolyticus]
MHNRRLPFIGFLLLPIFQILPGCSLIATPQKMLEGFPPDTVQQVRRQSAELDQLQDMSTATPAQQQAIKQLHTSLRQFENDVISTASRFEKQGDWHRAEQVLEGAIRALPDSQELASARQAFSERRDLREARLRMELAIHEGEQLLKDVDAYHRLQQLQGPGVMTWLEQKNFHRKRRESAETLHEYSQLALQRKDYVQAQRGLKIAQRLYGDDLDQDQNQRQQIERELAQVNREIRQSKPQPAKPAKASRKNANEIPLKELQEALSAGDLLGARKQLNRLRQQWPEHPQLLFLQSELQRQVDTQVEIAIKRGNYLYSQGEIERALEAWREAKALAPENVELQANIVRAEKVLENLKALSAPFGIKH